MQEMMKAMMQGQGGDQMDMEEMQSKDELCLRWYSGTDELSGMMASMGNGLGGLGGLGGLAGGMGGMPGMADMLKMMGMGGPGR